MSFKGWMVKRNVIYLHQEVLFSNKKELRIDTCNNLNGFQRNYSEFKKKAISKCHILHDSIYTTFLKWQNYRDGKQICGCQELGRERGEGGWRYKRVAGGILVIELFCIFTLVVITCIYPCNKSTLNTHTHTHTHTHMHTHKWIHVKVMKSV